MEKIELDVKCQACGGTGVYVGLAERDGAAVVCNKCDGTGCFHYVFEYEPFTERSRDANVQRVYKSGYGFVIAPTTINFSDIGTVDMGKEGISYAEFLAGAMPDHIHALACPMSADQSTCHKIAGFVDECMRLHGDWIGFIPKCRNQPNRAQCWERFEAGRNPK